MVKILFVCLGNICRSPVAEGIMKKIIMDKRLNSFVFVDSAGTSNFHIGQNPDSRSVANALKNGIVLSHKARQIKTSDFYEFDYIAAMDESNYADINQYFKNLEGAKSNVFLIRDYETPEFKNEKNVPDPYYESSIGFQRVFDILTRCCNNFIRGIEDQHKFVERFE